MLFFGWPFFAREWGGAGGGVLSARSLELRPFGTRRPHTKDLFSGLCFDLVLSFFFRFVFFGVFLCFQSDETMKKFFLFFLSDQFFCVLLYTRIVQYVYLMQIV